jgi:hypothetical protein
VEQQVAPVKPSKLEALQKALIGVSTVVNPLLEKTLKTQHEALSAEGSKLAVKSQSDFSSAVNAGKVPVTDNPWLYEGYQQQRAKQVASTYGTTLQEHYDRQKTDFQDDEDYTKVSEFLRASSSNVSGEFANASKEVRAILDPVITKSNADLYNTHVSERRKEVYRLTLQHYGENVLGSLDKTTKAMSLLKPGDSETSKALKEALIDSLSYDPKSQFSLTAKDAESTKINTIIDFAVRARKPWLLEEAGKSLNRDKTMLNQLPEWQEKVSDAKIAIEDANHKTETRAREQLSRAEQDDTRAFNTEAADWFFQKKNLTQEGLAELLKKYPGASVAAKSWVSVVSRKEENPFDRRDPAYQRGLQEDTKAIQEGRKTMADINVSKYNASDAARLYTLETNVEERKLSITRDYGVNRLGIELKRLQPSSLSPNKSEETLAFVTQRELVLNKYAPLIKDGTLTPEQASGMAQQELLEGVDSFLANKGIQRFNPKATTPTQTQQTQPQPLQTGGGYVPSVQTPNTLSTTQAGKGTAVSPFPFGGTYGGVYTPPGGQPKQSEQRASSPSPSPKPVQKRQATTQSSSVSKPKAAAVSSTKYSPVQQQALNKLIQAVQGKK